MKNKLILWIAVLILFSSFAAALNCPTCTPVTPDLETAPFTLGAEVGASTTTLLYMFQNFTVNATVDMVYLSVIFENDNVAFQGTPNPLYFEIFPVYINGSCDVRDGSLLGTTSSRSTTNVTAQAYNDYSLKTPLLLTKDVPYCFAANAPKALTGINWWKLGRTNNIYADGLAFKSNTDSDKGRMIPDGDTDFGFRIYGILNVPDTAPILTETYNTGSNEGTLEEVSFRLERYNITAASNATLIYNNTEYAGTINHINNNNVTFTSNAVVPIIYSQPTNVPFNWNYTLVYANGTIENLLTSGHNQSISWNLTKYPRINVTATRILNNSPISSFSISNGTTYSTTSGNIFIIGTDTEEFFIDSEGLELKSLNISFVNGSLTTLNFNLYTTNSFNLTFRDAETGSLISGNVSLDIIGDTTTFQYNTSNSTLYIDLLIPEHYTFRYSAEGYNTNQYEYDLTNRTHNALTFYMDNATDIVTVTVYDSTSLNRIEGAKVYLHKFDISTGAFSTISIYTTDPSGNAYFFVNKGEEYYKFSVDYPDGSRKLDTEKFYINSDTINLYISLSEEVGKSFFSEQSIDYTLVWDESGREFIVNYADSEAAAAQYCLYLKEYGHYGTVTHNSTCLTTSAGSISLSPPAANNTYFATFTAKISGEERILKTVFAELGTDNLNAGAFGIFLTIVLIMIFAFMGTINIMALFFASAALVFTKLLGLITLGWGEIIAIFIVSLIISLVLHFKK